MPPHKHSHAQTAHYAPDTCLIEGTVLKVEQWLKKTYENAPSVFNDAYVRLTVRIKSSEVYERFDINAPPGCLRFKEGWDAHFKLCSPTTPRPGDAIKGIASRGIYDGQDGCIFDLQVTEESSLNSEEE